MRVYESKRLKSTDPKLLIPMKAIINMAEDICSVNMSEEDKDKMKKYIVVPFYVNLCHLIRKSMDIDCLIGLSVNAQHSKQENLTILLFDKPANDVIFDLDYDDEKHMFFIEFPDEDNEEVLQDGNGTAEFDGECKDTQPEPGKSIDTL
jgi:uncharacterized UPF0160 family protein